MSALGSETALNPAAFKRAPKASNEIDAFNPVATKQALLLATKLNCLSVSTGVGIF